MPESVSRLTSQVTGESGEHQDSPGRLDSSGSTTLQGVGRGREGVSSGRRRVVARVTAPAGVTASVWRPAPPLLGAEGPPCPRPRPRPPGSAQGACSLQLRLQQQPSPEGRATALTRARGQCAHSRGWPAGPREEPPRALDRMQPGPGSSPRGPGPSETRPGSGHLAPAPCEREGAALRTSRAGPFTKGPRGQAGQVSPGAKPAGTSG